MKTVHLYGVKQLVLGGGGGEMVFNVFILLNGINFLLHFIPGNFPVDLHNWKTQELYQFIDTEN